MDLAVIIGLVLAVGSILGATIMDGGVLQALVSPSAFLLVIGGTLGATAVSHSMAEITALPKLIITTLREKKTDPAGTTERLVAFAQKARREGLLSLEEDLSQVDEPFLVRGLQMVVDGADPEMVRSILETEIVFTERRHQSAGAVFKTAGGFAPTMGIIGTVMGLIHVLSNLTDAGKLGPAIATAFLATFYGISSANVFWLPVGAKLEQKSKAELALKEMMLEGILSIQRGDNPSIVRDKLAVFLPRGRAADSEAASGEQERTSGEVA